MRVHPGAAHCLQHAVLAGVVGHQGQAPVSAEHAVKGFEIAHRRSGGVHCRQASVVLRTDRHLVVARGGRDELPQAGRAAAVAGPGAVAAFHERDQRKFGRHVGLTQLVDDITE